MRRIEKKREESIEKSTIKDSMTIDYSSGPEMAGKCGHMLWKQSNQSKPLWGRCVSAAVQLFSQNFPGKGALGGDPRGLLSVKFQKLGAQTILLNDFMQAKWKVIPKIGSPRSKSWAPRSKVKIPEKILLVFGGCKRNISIESSNLGAARGIANHPVQPNPTNHQCLPPFNLTLKADRLGWADVNLRVLFSTGIYLFAELKDLRGKITQ